MPQHGKLHKSQEVLLVVLLFAGAIGDCAAQGFPPCAPSSGRQDLTDGQFSCTIVAFQTVRNHPVFKQN